MMKLASILRSKNSQIIYYHIFLNDKFYYLCNIFSSRMINIQLEMAERCLELLMLPEDETCLLLDLGCGSGLSGSVAEDSGHIWFGMDISESMLSKNAFYMISE